jgi:hypothetical protein
MRAVNIVPLDIFIKSAAGFPLFPAFGDREGGFSPVHRIHLSSANAEIQALREELSAVIAHQ